MASKKYFNLRDEEEDETNTSHEMAEKIDEDDDFNPRKPLHATSGEVTPTTNVNINSVNNNNVNSVSFNGTTSTGLAAGSNNNNNANTSGGYQPRRIVVCSGNPFASLPASVQGRGAYRGGLIGYRDMGSEHADTSNTNTNEEPQYGHNQFRANILALLFFSQNQDNTFSDEELEYLRLKKKALTVKFLALVDIMFSFYWFISPNWVSWCMSMGIIFGIIGYYGATSLNKKATFVYLLYQFVIIGLRIATLVLYFVDNNSLGSSKSSVMSNTWLLPMLLILTLVMQFGIFGFVVSFWRTMPSDGMARFQQFEQEYQQHEQQQAAELQQQRDGLSII